MNIYRAIDLIGTRAERIVSQADRRQKLKIYTEGLKAKMRHVEIAFNGLSGLVRSTELVNAYDEVRTVGEVSEELTFYSDAFWGFLYSCLDFMAHVVTHAMNIGVGNERNVDFKQVENYLRNGSHVNTPIQKKFKSCLESTEFQELDKYRNCSSHRRRVYIKRVLEVSGAPEYTDSTTVASSVPVYRMPYLLCDDPYSLQPTTDEHKRIPDHMSDIKTKIFEHIGNIVRTNGLVR